jgi:hypothetical protein
MMPAIFSASSAWAQAPVPAPTAASRNALRPATDSRWPLQHLKRGIPRRGGLRGVDLGRPFVEQPLRHLVCLGDVLTLAFRTGRFDVFPYGAKCDFPAKRQEQQPIRSLCSISRRATCDIAAAIAIPVNAIAWFVRATN